jgi:hypothetical protein
MRYFFALAFALAAASASAGPSLLPREVGRTFIYGPKLVAVRGIGWHVQGREMYGHMQCTAEQYTDPARDFTIVGRDFTDPNVGTFILIRNVSWEAKLPLQKIDVKWASFDYIGGIYGVGILDARFNDDVLMPNIDPKEFERMMRRDGRVEFAVPADLLPAGNEPRLMVKGFGPEVTKKLKECYDAVEHESFAVPTGPTSKPLSCAFGQTCTVPGGEIKAVTKDLGTVRVPRTDPQELTTEMVSNAIGKHDRLSVQLPVSAPVSQPVPLSPSGCESGLSEIFGNKLPNDALLHQLCPEP